MSKNSYPCVAKNIYKDRDERLVKVSAVSGISKTQGKWLSSHLGMDRWFYHQFEKRTWHRQDTRLNGQKEVFFWFLWFHTHYQGKTEILLS